MASFSSTEAGSVSKVHANSAPQAACCQKAPCHDAHEPCPAAKRQHLLFLAAQPYCPLPSASRAVSHAKACSTPQYRRKPPRRPAGPKLPGRLLTPPPPTPGRAPKPRKGCGRRSTSPPVMPWKPGCGGARMDPCIAPDLSVRRQCTTEYRC